MDWWLRFAAAALLPHPKAAHAEPSIESAARQLSKYLLLTAAGVCVPWALGACHVGTWRIKFF